MNVYSVNEVTFTRYDHDNRPRWEREQMGDFYATKGQAIRVAARLTAIEQTRKAAKLQNLQRDEDRRMRDLLVRHTSLCSRAEALREAGFDEPDPGPPQPQEVRLDEEAVITYSIEEHLVIEPERNHT